MLKDKHVLIGVTGGIAAYKTAALVSLLKKRGASVRVVMTKHALEFVGKVTFEALSGEMVYTDLFEKEYEITHISLAKWADVCVVAPATANCMAKLACGIADDLLSTTLMAMPCPIYLAPAMNSVMWENPATQDNLKLLASRGIRFIGPDSGKLACGDVGRGRMSEPEEIVSALESEGTPQDLAGLNVMVTAGPTVERIDPVRYITNRSSGKMGYAIAAAAAKRGARVTLVSGPVAITPPVSVELVSIESSAELFEQVTSRAPSQDVIIQAAAPADFTPAEYTDTKIKKDGNGLTLSLVSTRDIARYIGERKTSNQTLVAFAAETNDLIENARKKLLSKNADLIVANDVTQPGAGFGTDTNIVTLITNTDTQEIPLADKSEIADRILDRVIAIRSGI